MSGRKTRKGKRHDSSTRSECGLAESFYNHLNQAWMRDTVIPPTETRITQAYFLRQQINKELRDVIDTSIRQQPEGSMATLWASWQVAEREIVPRGLSPVLQVMMSMRNARDVVQRIGYMNRYGIPAPLAIYIQGDPRDHRRCRVFIEEGMPAIGIPEYWLWREYTGHRSAYKIYVDRLAAATGLDILHKGYETEKAFADFYPSITERTKRINMLTYSELREAYGDIDWEALFEAWGLPACWRGQLQYNVVSHSFLHHLNRCMTTWTLERWQGWFALMVTQWMAGMAPLGPLRTAWFGYNRRFLQGMESDDTATELRYAIIREVMPNTLGKLWVPAHCPASMRRQVRTMVERIREAAITQIRTTSWMAESTRAAAARKLRKLDIEVCWPDWDAWEATESTCGLSRTDLVGNLMTLAALGTDRNLRLLQEGNCRKPNGDSWGKPVYVVNAYYYPDENRFLLPAAILRPPFFDPAKSAAWNYGAIGATIGHELCHAFDAEGRRYDENGDKRDWWTERDDREYRKRARRVVRLFGSTKYRGLAVDGELTLVENIADLGGLEFALAGLRSALGRTPKQQELREFFEAYAISWRSKDRLQRARELLATDVHSPPKLRVDLVVRHMDEWYEAFRVPENCDSYVPPSQRIHFFA
jgi:putative endopeptidase